MICDTFPLITRIITQCWSWLHTLWGDGGLTFLFIVIVITVVVGRIILPIINAQFGEFTSGFIQTNRPERVNRVTKTNSKGSKTSYYHSERKK